MKTSWMLAGAILALLGPAGAWGQVPAPAGKPAGTSPRPFILQGELGSPATGMAYLFSNNSDHRADSAQVREGCFSIQSAAVAGTQAELYVVSRGPLRRYFAPGRPVPRPLPLYLGPGTIRVSSPDSLANATVAGSRLNVDNSRLQAALKPVDARLEQFNEKYYRHTTQAQRQAPELRAALEADRASLTDARKQVLRAFLKASPSSPLSLIVLNEYPSESLDPTEMEPLFRGLAPAIRGSAAGQAYAARLAAARSLTVGELAPDFTQNDVNGKPVSLKDFRGKYVLVDFWASWCGPCRRENPNLLANYTRYKARNFTVLGVSLEQDNGRAAWLKAIATDHLPWTQVSDLQYWDNAVARRYNIRFVPQNFLIGPDGRIIAKNLDGEALGQKLAAVLPAAAP